MFKSKMTRNSNPEKQKKSDWKIGQAGWCTKDKKDYDFDELLKENFLFYKIEKFVYKHAFSLTIGALAMVADGFPILEKYYPYQTYMGLGGAVAGIIGGYLLPERKNPNAKAWNMICFGAAGFVSGFAYESYHLKQKAQQEEIHIGYHMKTSPLDPFKQTMAEAVAMKPNTIAYPGTLKPV
jgi:hypothetical protein